MKTMIMITSMISMMMTKTMIKTMLKIMMKKWCRTLWRKWWRKWWRWWRKWRRKLWRKLWRKWWRNGEENDEENDKDRALAGAAWFRPLLWRCTGGALRRKYSLSILWWQWWQWWWRLWKWFKGALRREYWSFFDYSLSDDNDAGDNENYLGTGWDNHIVLETDAATQCSSSPRLTGAPGRRKVKQN